MLYKLGVIAYPEEVIVVLSFNGYNTYQVHIKFN